MKKLLLLFLFLLLPLAAHGQVLTFTANCTGTASTDTANFTAIKSTIGSSSGTIRIPYKTDTTKRCKLNNFTTGTNVTLDNTDGSGISIVTGQTLTVTGGLVNPSNRQFFFNATAGLGTVTISSTFVTELYPQMWGAFPSNSAASNNAPMQAFFKGLGVGRLNGAGANNRAGRITGNFHVSTAIVLDDFMGFNVVGTDKLYSGFTQDATNTILLSANHIAYGNFHNLTFTTAASQNTAMIDLDSHDTVAGELSPQQIHFQNVTFSGLNVGYVGVRIANSGGAAQGDSITFEEYIATGFTQAAFQIGGGADGTPTALAFNAIYLRFKHGDIQSCPKYGIAVYGGSILVDGAIFENQTLNGQGLPTQTGADIYIYGPQNISDIRNVRSESLRFLQGQANLSNITMSPYGTSWRAQAGTLQSLSNTLAFVDQLVTGTEVGGNGKLYKVTAAPFAPQSSFQPITAPFDTCPGGSQCVSTFTDADHSYTPGAWAGHYVQIIYPNCFGQGGSFGYYFRTIASNDAHTFTVDSPIFAPGDVSPAQACGLHTTFSLFTNPGSPFPAWTGLPLTVATGGSSTTIVASGAGWGVNAFLGWRASILAGTGRLQYGIITGNTADTITVAGGWVTDYELEFLPVYGIASPDNSSQFVVEPNWGTQTSDGVITWEPFEFNVIDGNPIISSFYGGTIDGFRGSMGGRIKANRPRLRDVVISRTDALTGGSLWFDDVIIPGGIENVLVNRVINGGERGIPWLVKRNSGNQVLGPGVTQRTQGTEPICWQAGETGGAPNYPDLCIGRGDDQFANTTTNKDIFAFTGKWGRRTARGTNQAGTDTDFSGGLNTGSGAPGGIRLFLGSVGSSGATPGTLSVVAGVSPTRMWYSNKGADVASASTITPTGNLFHVTGTTGITSVSGTGVIAGTSITMVFDGVLTVTNGSNLKLSGDYTTVANDSLSVYYDGSNWIEQARSRSSSSSPSPGFISMSSGTLAASTTRYITFGGTLGLASESLAQAAVGGCVVRNLRVNLPITSPAAGTLVVTLRKNGVDTGLTVTITAGTTAQVLVDTTHSVTFSANDLLSFSVVNNDASNSFTLTGFSFNVDLVRQ